MKVHLARITRKKVAEGHPVCMTVKPKHYNFTGLAPATTCKRCKRTKEYRRRLQLWNDVWKKVRLGLI